jgi:hypothetical protein
VIRFFLTACLGILVVASNAWSHGGSHGGSATLDPHLKGSGPDLHLYRESSCLCCTKWGKAMAASGFNVIDHVKDNLDTLKQTEGVPPELASCHTAFVEGYVLEGHVPVQSVQRLLREMPEITGLAVPGMPLGSPGMEAPNVAGDRYDVIALQTNGTPTIYDSYQGLTLR